MLEIYFKFILQNNVNSSLSPVERKISSWSHACQIYVDEIRNTVQAVTKLDRLADIGNSRGEGVIKNESR